MQVAHIILAAATRDEKFLEQLYLSRLQREGIFGKGKCFE